MYTKIKSRFNLTRRSVVGTCVAAGLFCVLYVSSAQDRAGGDSPSRFMDRIDHEEGAQRLAAFRSQRLVGDYCFGFVLEHKPRRARSVRYEGIMWGSWNEKGPVTRFRLYPNIDGGQVSSVEPVELIIQNGREQEAWMRVGEGQAFQRLEGEDLFAPILPELLYSPFDLQMPFVYWDDFTYEGPTLVGASRVAQQFLMHPPEASSSDLRGIHGVRIGLDDTYDALWRVEVVGADGETLSRFSVESFKKVQEQYIVKRITLKDYATRDRTTFEVETAAVGLALDSDLFDAENALPLDGFIPEEMQQL